MVDINKPAQATETSPPAGDGEAVRAMSQLDREVNFPVLPESYKADMEVSGQFNDWVEDQTQGAKNWGSRQVDNITDGTQSFVDNYDQNWERGGQRMQEIPGKAADSIATSGQESWRDFQGDVRKFDQDLASGIRRIPGGVTATKEFAGNAWEGTKNKTASVAEYTGDSWKDYSGGVAANWADNVNVPPMPAGYQAQNPQYWEAFKGSAKPAAIVGGLWLGNTENVAGSVLAAGATAAATSFEGAHAAQNILKGGPLQRGGAAIGETILYTAATPVTGSYDFLTKEMNMEKTDAKIASLFFGLGSVAAFWHGFVFAKNKIQDRFKKWKEAKNNPETKLSGNQKEQMRVALKKRKWGNLIGEIKGHRRLLGTLGLGGLAASSLGIPDKQEIPKNHFAGTISKIDSGENVSQIRSDLLGDLEKLAKEWTEKDNNGEPKTNKDGAIIYTNQGRRLLDYTKRANQGGSAVKGLASVLTQAEKKTKEVTLEISVNTKNASAKGGEQKKLTLQGVPLKKFRAITQDGLYLGLASGLGRFKGVSFSAKDENGNSKSYRMYLDKGELRMVAGKKDYFIEKIKHRSNQAEDKPDTSSDSASDGGDS